MKIKIIVRLFNGVLSGCEFSLEEGRTLFLVTDDKSICEHHQSTSLPDNTIFIPGRSDSNNSLNFEIIVSSQQEKVVTLLEISEQGIHEKAFRDNEIVTVGLLKVAWRYENDQFKDEILYAKENSNAVSNEPHEVHNNSRGWKVMAALCVTGCLAFAGYLYLTETQRKISSVSALLHNEIDNYRIVLGKDNLLYIIAFSEKSARWAAQTMGRTPVVQPTRIVTVDSEEHRIARWIKKQWPQVKFHRIILDDPFKPVIENSAERTKFNSGERAIFIAALKEIIPYASSLTLTKMQDKEVKFLAEQGLKKIAVNYTEVINKDSITFIIRGAFDDNELERIKCFINDYTKTWGGEYIQYALELKDDWLKGRSYQYGNASYIKLSPGHWYFPDNTK